VGFELGPGLAVLAAVMRSVCQSVAQPSFRIFVCACGAKYMASSLRIARISRSHS
jgi:hypothetical protein